MNLQPRSTTTVANAAQGTAVAVLAAISICHMLNDVIQSLIMAIYPMLKEGLALDFSQIGLITFTFQFTASVLQPLVGYVTDRYPTPYSLVLGMSSSLMGVLLIAFATSYTAVLAAAALIGMGSSVFHPESSRVARLASGGRHGMAQSVFQVGGNFGTALGPCSRPSLCFLMASAALPGSPSRRCSPSCSWRESAPGTARRSS